MQQAGINGGAITTVANGISSAVFSGAYGTFSTNIVSGAPDPGVIFPDLLFSNALETSSSAAGTLIVWVTAQGLREPTRTANLNSSFTANEIPSGWKVTEKTFYDAENGLFTTTTPAGSMTFTAIGTQTASDLINFTIPFSVTHKYVIVATGAGSTNNTIDTKGSGARLPCPARHGTAGIWHDWLDRTPPQRLTYHLRHRRIIHLCSMNDFSLDGCVASVSGWAVP